MSLRSYSIGITMAVIFVVTIGCGDLIEESIEKEVVVVITPTDRTISKNYTQTFWWEDLKGALNYKLQIVYNRFDSAGEFKLDTLLTKNKFTVTLKPARYQWRVLALNGSSQTDVSTIQNLRIDSTSIAGQDLLLTFPTNNFVSSNPDVNFKWEELPGATEYRLQLFTSSNASVLDSTVKGVSALAYTIQKDSSYYWNVTGKRESVFSNPSEQWHFVIDRIAPDSVGLVTPLNGASVTSPVTLSWNAPDDSGLFYYEIYIFLGNTTTPFSDKYNPYSTLKDANPLKNSFNFTEGSLNDKVLWKVRAVDKAGNRSSGEKTRTFTIR